MTNLKPPFQTAKTRECTNVLGFMRGVLTIKIHRIMDALAKNVECARMSESVFPQNLSGRMGNWKLPAAKSWCCIAKGKAR